MDTTQTLRYVKPRGTSRGSDAKHVAAKLAALINALDDINGWLMEDDSEMLATVRPVFSEIVTRLKADGWDVSPNGTDEWQVKPPKH